MIVYIICKATFYNRPHWNYWSIDSKGTSIWRVAKWVGNKEIICFVWLYLKNQYFKFQLILLDHITSHIIFQKSKSSQSFDIHPSWSLCCNIIFFHPTSYNFNQAKTFCLNLDPKYPFNPHRLCTKFWNISKIVKCNRHSVCDLKKIDGCANMHGHILNICCSGVNLRGGNKWHKKNKTKQNKTKNKTKNNKTKTKNIFIYYSHRHYISGCNM